MNLSNALHEQRTIHRIGMALCTCVGPLSWGMLSSGTKFMCACMIC